MAVICKQCYWCSKNVGMMNFWASIMLFSVKLIGAILGKSQALLADAIHSSGDIMVSLILVIGLKITGVPPDEDHHWGHGNIEFIIASIIGVLLLFAAITVTVISLTSILEGTASEPSILAAWAAIISIVTNELLFRHSMCIGKQMNSPAMIANAWQTRADVFSSAAAFVGVFGAKLGFTHLDPVAAIVVAFVIAKSGVQSLIMGVHGMTDHAVDRKMLEHIKEIVMRETIIKDIGRMRARRIGQKYWVDVEVMFDPEFKMSEIRRVVANTAGNISDEIDNIIGVNVIPRVAASGIRE